MKMRVEMGLKDKYVNCIKRIDFFNEKMFKLLELNGLQEPFLFMSREDSRDKSRRYTVLNSNLEEAVSDFDKVYLPIECYILVEFGTKGFHIEKCLFSCKTEKTKDTVVLEIKEEPKILKEKFHYIDSKVSLLSDTFEECLLNNVIGPISKDLLNLDTFSRTFLNRIEQTSFLNIVDCEKDKYIYCQIEAGSIKRLRNHEIFVQRTNGYFTLLNQDDNLENTELLKIVDIADRYSYVLAKYIETFHDIELSFWAKFEILYRYPQDSLLLIEKFPKLFMSNFNSLKSSEQFITLTESPYLLDITNPLLFVPCEYVKATGWSMKVGIFDFSLRDGGGITPRFGVNNERILCAPIAIKVVCFNGHDYLVSYRRRGFYIYEEQEYVSYSFAGMIAVNDLIEKIKKEEQDLCGCILYFMYNYAYRRFNLTPPVISEEAYKNFVKLTLLR